MAITVDLVALPRRTASDDRSVTTFVSKYIPIEHYFSEPKATKEPRKHTAFFMENLESRDVRYMLDDFDRIPEDHIWHLHASQHRSVYRQNLLPYWSWWVASILWNPEINARWL
jgi:hypothetical protein